MAPFRGLIPKATCFAGGFFTDMVEGSSVTRTRNPDYWGHDEKYPQNQLPYIDTLEWLIIPEEATLMSALRSGKIDLRGFSGGGDLFP